MNREQVKLAADALGRLEALEAALDALENLPHDALPISFPSATVEVGEEDAYGGKSVRHIDLTGIKAFYPRTGYREVLCELIDAEEEALDQLGVERE